MLNDTSDQRMIKNALDTVCLHLPDSISNECEKLVAEFTKPAIELLINLVDTDTLCAAFRMCKAKPNKDDKKCIMCEFVIQTLDETLTQNATEAQIRQGLENLCSYMPKNIRPECTDLVDEYTDQIIDLITNGLSPKEVCDALGLCNAAASPNVEVAVRRAVFETIKKRLTVDMLVAEDEEERLEGSDDRPYCTLCTYAIGEVDQMLEDKKNEEEIKEALDKICYMLT